MKVFAGVKLAAAPAAVVALGIPRLATGQELINRRDQARKAVLATPQSLYAHYCAHCHGEDGTGGGRLWATELPASPPDLTTLGKDKEHVAAVIRNGSAAQGKSPLCPPWAGTISAANVERLAQYAVSLGAQASQPQPSRSFQPVREPFPWLLLAMVVAGVVLLWRMVRRRKEASHAVS